MRAKLFEEVAVRALVEEVQVERAEQRAGDHAHTGVTRSRIPRRGMRTQSGRRFNSYRSSYNAFSSSMVVSCSSRSSWDWGIHEAFPAVLRYLFKNTADTAST